MTGSRWELVVVGGGVIGLSVAYEAVRVGWRVLILERDRAGGGAGAVAAGMLAPACEADSEAPELGALAVASCEMYPGFVEAVQADGGVPCRYRREGTIVCALNRDDEAELARLAALQARLGLPVAWLSARGVLDREPHISPRVTGGLFAAGDRQVDPRALLRALAAAVERRAGGVWTSAEVEQVASSAVGVEVRYRRGAERGIAAAERAVVCAGAWSAAPLARALGPVTLRPVKGQILRLRSPTPLLRHVVRTPHVYLVPREDGELVVGATLEEQGFDGRVTAGAVLDLLAEARRVLPGVQELELAQAEAGFRPALRDHAPAIGATAVPGLYVAIGHYRHGVTLAPATARLLVELMTTGRTPALLEPFRPERRIE